MIYIEPLHFCTKYISNPTGIRDSRSAKGVQMGAKRCTNYFLKPLQNKGK